MGRAANRERSDRLRARSIARLLHPAFVHFRNFFLGVPMSYLLMRNGRQSGPFTEEQLKQFLAEGKVLPLDLVWTEGMAEWLPLIRVSFTSDPPQPKGAIPVSAEVQRGILQNRTRRLKNHRITFRGQFLVL